MYPLTALFRQRRLRWLLLPTLVAAVLAPLLTGSRLSGSRPAAEPSGILPLTEFPRSAQRVEVGIYPISVYGLDEGSNTFYADAYIWFLWNGDKDPTATMELVNAVQESDLTRSSVYEKPDKLPDGRFLQILRVEGRFFQPFTFRRFPLDEQRLSLRLEDTAYTADQIVYVPDKKNSGIGELLQIPGWKIRRWDIEGMARRYDTNFGDPRVGSGTSRFAHLRYELTITRPLSYFGWKLYLPLVIAMLLSWSALLIHGQEVEARTALPATALLTMVFLQLGYSQTLPAVGHLVLMDKIYVLAYLLIVVVLGEAITTAHWVRGEADIAGMARARRLDLLVLAFQCVAFFGGTALLIALG